MAALLALGVRTRGQADRISPGSEAHTGEGLPDWKAVFNRIRHDLTKRRIVALAAGVTFYLLLALFPAIAALVALYGLIADPVAIAEHLGNLSSFVPGGAIDVIGEQINRIAEQSQATKGLTVFVSLLVSLWSANGGVKAMFDALNVVCGVEESRGFVKLNAISIAFVIVGLVVVLIALGAVVAVPIVLNHFGMRNQTRIFVSIGRWPGLFVVVALMLALIYRYGPNRRAARWRWITWGSALAAVAWLVASILFSWYASNFGSFNKTYGSLGAVIGFMTWIWISAIVVLIGGELDMILEQPRKVLTATPTMRAASTESP